MSVGILDFLRSTRISAGHTLDWTGVSSFFIFYPSLSEVSGEKESRLFFLFMTPVSLPTDTQQLREEEAEKEEEGNFDRFNSDEKRRKRKIKRASESLLASLTAFSDDEDTKEEED